MKVYNVTGFRVRHGMTLQDCFVAIAPRNDRSGWKYLLAGLLTVVMVMFSMSSTALAAAEGSVAVKVSVSTYINFTVVDYGNAGLKFGSLTPGSTNNPEVDQNIQGAVGLELGADSNVGCNVSTRADDFVSGKDKLQVTNVAWNTSNNPSTSITMLNEYAAVTVLKPGQSQKLWHWLNVPATQAPGIYSADFYYQATRVS